MKIKIMGMIAFAAVLAVPVTALAGSASPSFSSPPDRTGLVNQLQQQERADEFKAKFWSQEPITQQDYYVQENEDQDLIAKISAGEPVSQTELEDGLKRIDTAY